MQPASEMERKRERQKEREGERETRSPTICKQLKQLKDTKRSRNKSQTFFVGGERNETVIEHARIKDARTLGPKVSAVICRFNY